MTLLRKIQALMKGDSMWLLCADDRTGDLAAVNLDQVIVLWTEEADPNRTPPHPNRVKPKWLLKVQTSAGVFTYQPDTPWQLQSEADGYLTHLTSVTASTARRLRQRGH